LGWGYLRDGLVRCVLSGEVFLSLM
jgi:hypothetical protein